MNDIPDRLYRLLKASDRILFLLYALCYLLFFQTDLERHVHHLINDGNLVFHPVLLSVFFTCVLVAAEMLVSSLKLFRNAWGVCNFLPSSLLLGAATSYNEEHFVGYPYYVWIIIIVVSLLVMLVLHSVSMTERNSVRTSIRSVRLNSFLMLMIMLIPVCIGNTDAAYHRTLHTETLNLMLKDKDVDGFERRIMNDRRYPDVNVSSWSDIKEMPSDYMQALLMRNHRNVDFTDSLKDLYPEQTDSMMRMYDSYLSLRTLGEKSLDSLTSAFGDTYWFYYDF